MDFLNFLMALSPIVVVLVGILGFKKSAKTVSPVALLWTLILAFTYFNLDGLTFAENIEVLDPLVWKGIKEGLKIVLVAFGARCAKAVNATLTGRPETFTPASFLQLHTDVEVYLDEAAAAQL